MLLSSKRHTVLSSVALEVAWVPAEGFQSAFLVSPVTCFQTRRQKTIARSVSPQGQKTAAISEHALGRVHSVTYRGKILYARHGENLRRLLLRNGFHPHNGGLLITCKGIGTCGTCAVTVDGCIEPLDPSWRERTRLSFPPHRDQYSEQKKLRLACQVRVVEDISVEKYDGFWGHGDNLLEHLS